MIKNYFKIAWRNLLRYKAFSLINILGLSIGISTALVIYLIVLYDLSFDTFHTDKEKIFRVTTEFRGKEGRFYNSGVTVPLKEAIQTSATEVENISGFYDAWMIGKSSVVNEGGLSEFKKPKHIIFADEQYFSLFKYKWLAGSAATALNEPKTVVLTESRANAYFSTTDYRQLLGKQITYDSIVATITGVVKDFEEATDFTFREFISMATITTNPLLKKKFAWDAWNENNSASQLFVKLGSEEKVESLKKQLAVISSKHQDKEDIARGDSRIFNLQPLDDIHFNYDYGNFDQRLANRKTLWGLSLIAAFLLVLGCINFVNLSTAQAGQRLKEIGVRKTIGSSRKQLILQFLGETFLITTVAGILSLAITPVILRMFADFIPAGLSFNPLQQPGLWCFFPGLVLCVSVLSGLYPAFYISGLQPANILKGNSPGGNRRSTLRKFLTVSQFVIAQVFIIATLMVGKQIQFLLAKDIGFKKEGIITVQLPSAGRDKQQVFLDKLNKLPGIEKISMGEQSPSAFGQVSWGLKYHTGKNEIHTQAQCKFGDRNYLDLYHLKLLAGRNLSTDTAKEFIINESYLKVLGFKTPQEAIGQLIFFDKPVPIVGVIADFNHSSLRSSVEPLVFTSKRRLSNTGHIALQASADHAKWQSTITQIDEAWKEIYPDEDFSFAFVDERIAGFYKSEQQISILLRWATALAIGISCLGLFGLAIYTINQRTKEIGVRKVLGASVTQIAALLSSDFIRLVIMAFLIAAPIAWLSLNKWLENFAYKSELNVATFLVAALMMMTIALFTICFQTIKAARANPVKSLRTE